MQFQLLLITLGFIQLRKEIGIVILSYYSERVRFYFFLRQIPIRLPGKVKYVCDFQVFWKDGTVTFEDVKGYKTAMYKRNKKQVEEIYPIKITEI